MARRRGTELPEPPWTQAPAEVTAWLSSTGGHRTSRGRPPPRQPRVRGFLWRCSPSEERRVLRRLTQHRFERVETGADHMPRVLTRLVHLPPPEVLQGIVAGTRARVRVREGTEPQLCIEFRPRVTVRVAAKALARLGVRVSEGKWF